MIPVVCLGRSWFGALTRLDVSAARRFLSDPRGTMDGVRDVLEQFGLATREWFKAAFAAPTAAQAGAWRAIGAGRNALVVAPTGSGKTLAAFLWSLDRLAHEPVPDEARSTAAGCSTSARSRRSPSTSSATCGRR